MPPQPLSKMKAVNHIFGTDGLAVRPEQATLVARAIAGWAVTETHLGHIFGFLIGASKPATMSMYAAMRSFDVQRTLLQTAAQELLRPRYADMLFAVLIVLGRAATVRHQFAHWIWGSSQDIPDALLLAEPKTFWHMRVERIRYWRRIKDVDGTVLLNEPGIDRSTVMVYRTKDLLEVCERMELSYRYAEALYQMISSKTARRRTIYDRLCDVPEIATALQRYRASQGRVGKTSKKVKSGGRAAPP
jgi:hypothetical protein